MIKKLVRHGDDWAVVIDQTLLESLNFNPEEPVELTVDGQSLILSPVTAASHKERVAAARAKVNAQHKAAFKRLAE